MHITPYCPHHWKSCRQSLTHLIKNSSSSWSRTQSVSMTLHQIFPITLQLLPSATTDQDYGWHTERKDAVLFQGYIPALASKTELNLLNFRQHSW